MSPAAVARSRRVVLILFVGLTMTTACRPSISIGPATTATSAALVTEQPAATVAVTAAATKAAS